MLPVSKLNNNKLIIPQEILKTLKKENTLVEWSINEKGKIELDFKKEVKFEDLPDECKGFYEELDEISDRMKSGDKITMDLDTLEKELEL